MRPLLRHARSLLALVAVLAVMLAGGVGLPGLVLALAPASGHVCTCTSGGTHASCPVCNPTLRETRRSTRPVADGAPCGDRRLGDLGPGEPSTLPAPFVALAAPLHRPPAPSPQALSPDDVHLEPLTPPPRSPRV